MTRFCVVAASLPSYRRQGCTTRRHSTTTPHYGTKPGHFETSKIRTSERCERTSERTSEWPSTYVSILVCSRPQCASFVSLLPLRPFYHAAVVVVVVVVLDASALAEMTFTALLRIFPFNTRFSFSLHISQFPRALVSYSRVTAFFRGFLLPFPLPLHCGLEQTRIET